MLSVISILVFSSVLLIAVDARTGLFSDAISLEFKSTGPETEIPIHPPLLVGSFNIQTLGPKKFKNVEIMYTIEEIVYRYDLLMMLEVMTQNDEYMKDFLRNVNRFAPEGVTYNMTLSEKHPITSENVAILYRTDKLKLLKAESYSDPQKFFRKPLVAIFEAYTLRDMRRFGVVGHHVKPAEAVRELDALADVYDYLANDCDTEDVLLMGDFNADCTYVKEGDWEKIRLWMRPDFTWAIRTGTDTTTNYRSCALDRFVYAGEKMNDGVILSSAQVFDFQNAFGLTLDEVRRVSDHWPIEIKLRGKMSDTAEQHLSTDLCFKVRDSQPRGFDPSPEDLRWLNGTNGTTVAETGAGTLLTTTVQEDAGLLNALAAWRAALPKVVTRELLEAVRFKMTHGSLKDESSFADVGEPGYSAGLLVAKGYLEATVCRATTVN